MLFTSCQAVEKTAYNTVVAAKAFTDKIKTQHPECSPGNASTLCVDLTKATSAKDTLIDAIEIYCAGPTFNGGGACEPPAKGTPAYTQATDKLSAAISSYSQAETDLKGVLK
jgi:hypothetical protein